MRICNFGSLNIDRVYGVDHFVRAGETLSCTSLDFCAGGKGLNQSIALARAGADVWHAGAIGEDGLFLKELLQESGVRTEHLRIVDAPTGHAIIQLVPEGGNCIIISAGANGCQTKEDVERMLSAFDAGDLLLVQNEVNLVGYAMRRAHEKGMVVAFNASPLDAAALSYPLDLVDIFLVNEVEGAELSACEMDSSDARAVCEADAPEVEDSENGAGGPGERGAGDPGVQGAGGSELQGAGDPSAIARALRTRFPRADVVLTLGSRGVVLAQGDRLLTHGVYEGPVVDTTGAGDTFCGYYLASVAKGLTGATALEMASLASSLAIAKKGAANSIPTWDEVVAYRSRAQPRG